MKTSIPGLVISCIILFISLIMLPTYFIGVINWRSDQNTAQTAARNFVDMVIDNRQITERAMSDLNLSLAGCSTTYTYKYYREEKITNPLVDASGKPTGQVEVTWAYVEVTPDTIWNTGDICTIVVKQEGMNMFQRVAMALLGTSYNTIEIRLSGMVR